MSVLLADNGEEEMIVKRIVFVLMLLVFGLPEPLSTWAAESPIQAVLFTLELLQPASCAVLGLLGLMTGVAYGNAFTFMDAETTKGQISRLVLTPEGLPWVVTENACTNRRGSSVYHLLYWDKGQFISPAPAVSVTGMAFSVACFGGAERSAWLTLLPGTGQSSQGTLLKLGRGKVDEVDTFRYSLPNREPQIYVAHDNRLFNWGESFLAQRKVDGTWSRIEAALPLNDYQSPPLIFEREGAVFFFVSPMLYVAEPDGSVTVRNIAGALTERNTIARRWGDGRIVVWPNDSTAAAFAFDIDSLRSISLPAAPSGFHLDVMRAFSSRDETLWLYGSESVDRRSEMTSFLMRLPPGATQFERLSQLNFPEESYTFGVVKTRLECADGTLVFGLDGLTLFSPHEKERVDRFDWRYGLSGPASDLQEERTGNRIWFVMNGQAVCFNRQIVPECVPAAECWEEIPILPESGLFQPRVTEIACFSKDGSALMRWNGVGWRNQRLPFDPKTVYLHGADDQGAIWVGDGAAWYQIGAQSVQTAELAQLSYSNYGQAPWIPREPVMTGGWFVYPQRDRGSFMMGDPVRVFENHQFVVRSHGTPFAGQYVLRMCEDLAGDLWFLTAHPHRLHSFRIPSGEVGLSSERSRLFRYKLSGQRLKSVPPPLDVCGRELRVVTTPGATPRQRILLARTDGGPWSRMVDGETSAQFRFASNGVYRCEITASEYGGMVPGIVTFMVRARVALPDTKRTDGDGNGLIRISAESWRPPVMAVPSSEKNVPRIMWRGAGASEWFVLDPDRQLELLDLKLGLQTVEFTAEEDGFWRDVTPLRLEVDVTLSMQDYLIYLSDALKSRDSDKRDRAALALQSCGLEAKELLEQLNKASQRLDKIRSAGRILGDPLTE